MSDWIDDVAAGASSLVPGVGPFVGGSIGRLTGKVRAELARVTSRALRAAEQTSGLSREDLADRLDATPELVPLLVRVLYAAGMTGHDEILDALGAALGTAVSDASAIDDAELIIIGLERIRPRHVRLLEQLLKRPPRPADAEPDSVIPWNDWSLAVSLAWEPAMTFSLAIGLVNAGFARTLSVWESTGFEITPLGRTLVEVLQTFRAAQPR